VGLALSLIGLFPFLGCLFLFVIFFLVFSTFLHIHTESFSTWLYVDGVGEFSHATPRQQLKRNLNPKSNAPLSHSCGVPQTTTPTQRALAKRFLGGVGCL